MLNYHHQRIDRGVYSRVASRNDPISDHYCRQRFFLSGAVGPIGQRIGGFRDAGADVLGDVRDALNGQTPI